MAGFVEVFQIQGVIPYLVDRCTVKGCLANFELDDEHKRADQEHSINSPSHTRDAELHED